MKNISYEIRRVVGWAYHLLGLLDIKFELHDVEREAAPGGAALAYPLDPRDAVGGCDASVDCEGGFGLGVIVTREATDKVHHLARNLFAAREELARSQRRFSARRMSAWKESALNPGNKADEQLCTPGRFHIRKH